MENTAEESDADTRHRWGLTPEQLATVRARLGKAANNSAGSGDRATFKTWQDAKETIRELDAVEGDQTHEHE